jgi:hypothetical protein
MALMHDARNAWFSQYQFMVPVTLGSVNLLSLMPRALNAERIQLLHSLLLRKAKPPKG